MSLYRCELCDTIKDGDLDVPEAYKIGLICEACQVRVGEYREMEKAELKSQLNRKGNRKCKY